MEALKKSLRDDPQTAWNWHRNVAHAAMEEGIDRPQANRIAAGFMMNWFGVDTTCNPEYAKQTDEWPDVVNVEVSGRR